MCFCENVLALVIKVFIMHSSSPLPPGRYFCTHATLLCLTTCLSTTAFFILNLFALFSKKLFFTYIWCHSKGHNTGSSIEAVTFAREPGLLRVVKEPDFLRKTWKTYKNFCKNLQFFSFKGISTIPKLFLRPLANQIQKLCFKKNEQKNIFLKIGFLKFKCAVHIYFVS